MTCQLFPSFLPCATFSVFWITLFLRKPKLRKHSVALGSVQSFVTIRVSRAVQTLHMFRGIFSAVTVKKVVKVLRLFAKKLHKWEVLPTLEMGARSSPAGDLNFELGTQTQKSETGICKRYGNWIIRNTKVCAYMRTGHRSNGGVSQFAWALVPAQLPSIGGAVRASEDNYSTPAVSYDLP